MSTNNAPAVTRKRRSSILKTKPRAPFSELEFNPPTPEAACKSRRVSFSRKKGVAEFVVNEATTTWKNFYEEQNRSVESSGNESELRPQVLNHQQFHEVEAEIDHTVLGNCAAPRGPNMTLFSDMNFTEQLASLDCLTADNCLKAPTQQFEPSLIGERSKIFAESFVNPVIVERTGSIEVDFSMIQQAPSIDYGEHDLSDIAKDVEQSHPIAGQQLYLKDRSFYVEVDLNETKGVALNDLSDMSITDPMMDKENLVVDSSFKPSVEDCRNHMNQEVLVFDGKKLKVAKIQDKLDDILNDSLLENKTTDALNKVKVDFSSGRLDSSNKFNQPTKDVLRCEPLTEEKEHHTENDEQKNPINSVHTTLMSQEISMMMDLSSIANFTSNPVMKATNEILSVSSHIEKTPRNYTTIIADHEQVVCSATSTKLGSRNISEILSSRKLNAFNKETTSDKPTNQPISHSINTQDKRKKKSIVLNHNDDLPNFTLDIPPQFDQSTMKGQKSVVYDSDDSVASMSTTQGILREIQKTSDLFNNENRKKTEISVKSKTLLYDIDSSLADLSMTKAVPAVNCMFLNKNNNSVTHNISGVEMMPSNFTRETNRQTVIFDDNDDLADLSLSFTAQTQGKLKKIDEMTDISMIKPKISEEINKIKKTIVPGNDDVLADVYVKQVVPEKMAVKANHNFQTIPSHDNFADLSITPLAPAQNFIAIPKKLANENLLKKSKSFKEYDAEKTTSIHDLAEMSMTMAIPQKLANQLKKAIFYKEYDSEKTTTIHDIAEMSMTMAMPQKFANQLEKATFYKEYDSEKITSIHDIAEMSMTTAMPRRMTNDNQLKKATLNKECDLEKTTSIHDIAEMSMTMALPQKLANEDQLKKAPLNKECDSEKTTSIHDIAEMSMTMAMPHKLANEDQLKKATLNKECDSEKTTSIHDIAEMSMTMAMPQKWTNEDQLKIATFYKECDSEKTTSIHDIAEMSMTMAMPQNFSYEDQLKKATLNKECDSEKTTSIHNIAEMSMTMAMPHKLANEDLLKKATLNKECDSEKTTSIHDIAEMSMTMAMPQKLANKDQLKKATFYKEHNSEKPTFIHDIAEMSTMPQKSANEPQEKNEKIYKEYDSEKTTLTQTMLRPHQTHITVDELGDVSMTQAFSRELATDPNQNAQTKIKIKSNQNNLTICPETVSQETPDKFQYLYMSTKSPGNKEVPDQKESSKASVRISIDREMQLVNGLLKNKSMAGIDFQKVLPEKFSVDQTRESVKQTSEKRKTLLLQMVDLSNSGGELPGMVDQSLGSPSGYGSGVNISLNKDDIIKVDSQSLQVGRHDDENCIAKDALEEQVIQNDPLTNKNAVCVKLGVEQHTLKSLISQSANGIDEKELTKNVKVINETNEVIDTLTEVADNMEKKLLVPPKTICITDSQKTLTTESNSGTITDGMCPKNHVKYNKDTNPDDGQMSCQLDMMPNNKKITIEELLDQYKIIQSSNTAVTTKENSMSNIGDKHKTKSSHANDDVMDISLEVKRNKTVRLSKEVVKTLNFEDEDSVHQEKPLETVHINPVKKNNTTLDVLTKSFKTNSKVIPEMYDTTLNNIKSLMQELVKPNVDLPFSSNFPEENENCTDVGTSHKSNISESYNLNQNRNTEIQSAGSHSPGIGYSSKEISHNARDIMEKLLQNDGTAQFISPNNTLAEKSNTHGTYLAKNKNDMPKSPESSDSAVTKLSKTIIFDHFNPLNNIGIASPIFTEIDTAPRTYTKVDTLPNHASISISAESVTQFDVSNPLNNIRLNVEKFGSKTITVTNNKDKINKTVTLSDSPEFVQNVDPKEAEISHGKLAANNEVTDVEKLTEAIINNEELVDNTSCITFVDETLDVSAPLIENESESEIESIPYKKSILSDRDVDVLYMIAKERFNDGEMTDEGSKTDQTKNNDRKRVLSPRKRVDRRDCTLQLLECTPNLPRKCSKLSNSPIMSEYSAQDDTATNKHGKPDTRAKQMVIVSKSPVKILSLKSEESYLIKTHDSLKSPDSKDLMCGGNATNEEYGNTVASKECKTAQDRIQCPKAKEVDSVQSKLEDVVGAIDALPFMGTWCCAWEQAESSSWSLLLMHASVRLRVLLARDDGGARAPVPPCTPVRAVHVDTIPAERGHAVAALCVRACAAALRAEAAAGCARAADVPPLLVRCAAAAREAARFGRAMQHASMRLAYRLQDDVLTLQVANIPLRSIWEVSLRVAVGGPAGPRAADVHVSPVCVDERVAAPDVRALLATVPDGWGHVPDTLWKIFNHLKDKRKEDFSWHACEKVI